MLCVYNERRRVNLKFCVADFVYVIQKASRRHYNSCICSIQMLAVTPQVINHVNKIRQAEL